MSEPFSFVLPLAAGFVLGVVFYGGLWLTLRALSESRYPALVALGSFWGRTALVLAGMVWATDHRWQNAVACLAGFTLARIALARWIPHAAMSKGVK